MKLFSFLWYCAFRLSERYVKAGEQRRRRSTTGARGAVIAEKQLHRERPMKRKRNCVDTDRWGDRHAGTRAPEHPRKSQLYCWELRGKACPLCPACTCACARTSFSFHCFDAVGFSHFNRSMQSIKPFILTSYTSQRTSLYHWKFLFLGPVGTLVATTKTSTGPVWLPVVNN